MNRRILYANDFTSRSALFSRRSVGVLYISPSSFHIRSRRSQTYICTLSVTPAAVSTNAVTTDLISDLASGSIDKLKCVDFLGEQVKVFFNIIGFIEDYPASTAVVYLKSHTATALCTCCGFTFSKVSCQSAFAYATLVHSCTTLHKRSQYWAMLLRELGHSKADIKCLGMNVADAPDFINSGHCQLLKFEFSYNDALQNSQQAQLFKAFVEDAYDLRLIAPDHLITGPLTGMLTIVFIQLQSDEERDKLQIQSWSSLTQHVFQSHLALYKNMKQKIVPELSMSSLYCLLTGLSSTLEALGFLEQLPSKRLLTNLHR